MNGEGEEAPAFDGGEECRRCGTCCTAPDISSIGKPLGVKCDNLRGDHTCSIYELRPEVCRRYTPDYLCRLVDAPTLWERTEKYLRLFSLNGQDQS